MSSIHTDGEVIWVATFANGLFLFDPQIPSSSPNTGLTQTTTRASRHLKSRRLSETPRGTCGSAPRRAWRACRQTVANIVRITATELAGKNTVLEGPGSVLWLPFNETMIWYNQDTGSTRTIAYANVGAGFTSPYNDLVRFASRPNSVFAGTDSGALLEFDARGDVIDKHVVQPLQDADFLSVMTAVELREQPGNGVGVDVPVESVYGEPRHA